MQEFRCAKCNSMLLMQDIQIGHVEVQCRKTACKYINILDIKKTVAIVEVQSNKNNNL